MKKDISRKLVFILIILTIIVSSVSTWILVDSAASTSAADNKVGGANMKLKVSDDAGELPVLTDLSSGNVKLSISKPKEVD